MVLWNQNINLPLAAGYLNSNAGICDHASAGPTRQGKKRPLERIGMQSQCMGVQPVWRVASLLVMFPETNKNSLDSSFAARCSKTDLVSRWGSDQTTPPCVRRGPGRGTPRQHLPTIVVGRGWPSRTFRRHVPGRPWPGEPSNLWKPKWADRVAESATKKPKGTEIHALDTKRKETQGQAKMKGNKGPKGQNERK